MDWRLPGLALAVTAVTSCGTPQPQNHEATTAIARPEAAPADLASFLRRAHFAFTRNGSRWEGGHDNYAVRVGGDGALEAEARGVGVVRLSLRTLSIGCGDERLDDVSVTDRAPDGHIQIRRGAVTEHVRNTEEGFEQSWTFATAPDCDAPLDVQVAARGAPWVSATSTGLHFRDDQADAGFVYGHGTFVDARGERTSIPAVWHGGTIRLRVPLDVLRRSAFPATLDPIVGPETAVDAPLRLPAFATQPRVAFASSVYLVVWKETSLAREGIRAARLSDEGIVLDPFGFDVSPGKDRWRPVVTSSGGAFLVSWADRRSGSLDEVYGARVTDAGAVLDGASNLPLVTGTNVTDHAVSYDGTNYVLAYANGDVFAKRVQTTGVVLDPTPLAVSTAPYRQSAVSIASTSTQSLIAWADTRSGALQPDVYGARVTSALSLLDGPALSGGIPISTAASSQNAPQVASNGLDFLVAWNDYRSAAHEVWASRVDTSGTLLDGPASSGGVRVATNSYPGLSSAGFDGTNYWLVLRDGRGAAPFTQRVTARRVTSSGVLLDGPPTGDGVIISAGVQIDGAALAFGTKNSLVVEEGARSSSTVGVFATRVSKSAVPLDVPATSDHILVAARANAQDESCAAFGGGNHLVVWRDHRYPNGGIYGVRVSPSGVPLETDAIPLAIHPADGAPGALSFDGSSFVLVFGSRRGTTGSASYSTRIYATRVSTTGTLLDGTPADSGVLVASATATMSEPTIASSGPESHLVVWSELRSAGWRQLYGMRLGPGLSLLDGTAAAGGFAVTGGTAGNREQPVISWNGANYLVAWYESSGALETRKLYGGRVSTAGALLDGLGAPGLALDAIAGRKTGIATASDGASHLVLYRTSSAIQALRVPSTGSPTALGSVTSAASSGDLVRAAWDGAGYVIAWDDPPKSFVRWMSSAGASLSGVTELATAWRPHALSSSTDQRALLTYAPFSDPLLGEPRIRARVLDRHDANGAPCTTATSCASGFCVDGVCCDSACGGGLDGDCQACSVARGSLVDGTCGIVKAGTLCRAATGACDRPEACDGSTITCPVDAPKTDGTSCDDGDACTITDSCLAGVCKPGEARSCVASHCHVSTGCAPSSGCMETPAADGTPCDGGTCTSGSCVPSIVDAGPDAVTSDAGGDVTGEVADGSTDAAPEAGDSEVRTDTGAVADAADAVTDDAAADATPDSGSADVARDTGSPAEVSATSEVSGCSCSQPASSRASALGWAVPLAVLVAARRRRARARVR